MLDAAGEGLLPAGGITPELDDEGLPRRQGRGGLLRCGGRWRAFAPGCTRVVAVASRSHRGAGFQLGVAEVWKVLRSFREISENLPDFIAARR